ncbi:MAG: hypothetical protein GY906_22430 [bacterium]|nr:hypothetical protein [bacterium]
MTRGIVFVLVLAVLTLSAFPQSRLLTFFRKRSFPTGPIAVKFRAPGRDVGIFREDRGSGSSTYWLCEFIGDTYYWCVALDDYPLGVPSDNHHLQQSEIRVLGTSVDQEDASVTLNGTWAKVSDAGLVYLDYYRRSNTATDYAEWTSPASTTVVGVRGLDISNAGVSVVSIDGDATAADLLPTAQDLVDATTLSSDVLVANGGNLNPTDRVLNQYAAVADKDVPTLFNSSLTAGQHTVRLTVSGEKQAASGDTRAYITGFFSSDGTQRMDSAGTSGSTDLVMAQHTILMDEQSTYEYAIQFCPTGATTSCTDWVGNGHDHDTESSLAITVDGAAVTPAEDAYVMTVYGGRKVRAVRTSTLDNAEVGDIGTMVATYTLHPTYGLHTQWRFTFDVPGGTTFAYGAMLPLNDGIFDKGSTVGASDVTLGDDDDTHKANAESSTGYAWDADGNWGAMLWINQAKTVYSWQKTTSALTIEDRSGGTLNKLYARRVDGVADDYVSGTVWRGDYWYQVGYFSGGANGELANQ